jgi:hypothetical protein
MVHRVLAALGGVIPNETSGSILGKVGSKDVSAKKTNSKLR